MKAKKTNINIEDLINNYGNLSLNNNLYIHKGNQFIRTYNWELEIKFNENNYLYFLIHKGLIISFEYNKEKKNITKEIFYTYEYHKLEYPIFHNLGIILYEDTQLYNTNKVKIYFTFLPQSGLVYLGINIDNNILTFGIRNYNRDHNINKINSLKQINGNITINNTQIIIKEKIKNNEELSKLYKLINNKLSKIASDKYIKNYKYN